MANPWLDIPLSDYESHMALAQVAQAQLLADILDSVLKTRRPMSLAVIGCAGGNGFDRIDSSVTTRVVAVDINPRYVDELRRRHEDFIPGLETLAGDIQDPGVRFDPVELVYAALLLEYVDVPRTLDNIRSLLVPDGVVVTVVQLPAPNVVTPSPYRAMGTLASVMRLVDPDVLEASARNAGYRELERRREQSAGKKDFMVQTFALRR